MRGAKAILLLAVGAAAGFGTGWTVRGSADEPAASAPPTSFFAPADRPARGAEDARVELVEFTDYQCPYCRRFYRETWPEILAEYGDRVKFVVRNFPLRSIHPDAQKAAEAAECAFAQGRFWAYHDHLFETPSALAVSDLKEHARTLGLDGDRFDRCLDSGEMAAVVERDLRAGIRFGVTGTPAFFINGRMLVGAQPPRVVRAFLDAALEAARTEAAGRDTEREGGR